MSTSTTLSNPIALFAEASVYARKALSMVTPADLDRPTPCESWNVRTVALHLADVADAVIDLTVTGVLAMPTPRETTTPEPVAVAQRRIHTLDGAVAAAARNPDRADVATRAAAAGATELAAHGWDLATACRADLPIPDGTATALLALTADALGDDARGDLFAAAVPVAPTATPSDRFVAFLGRSI